MRRRSSGIGSTMRFITRMVGGQPSGCNSNTERSLPISQYSSPSPYQIPWTKKLPDSGPHRLNLRLGPGPMRSFARGWPKPGTCLHSGAVRPLRGPSSRKTSTAWRTGLRRKSESFAEEHAEYPPGVFIMYDDDYATCSRTYATLVIKHSGSSKITERLGIEPSRSQRKGELTPSLHLRSAHLAFDFFR